MQHDAGDKKLTNKIQATYTLEGTVLENVKNIKNTSDLRWNTHISNICTKANRTLGFFLSFFLVFLLDIMPYALADILGMLCCRAVQVY